MRATTLSFQVFLYLLLDHSLLDCPKQFKADTFINKWQGAPSSRPVDRGALLLVARRKSCSNFKRASVQYGNPRRDQRE